MRMAATTSERSKEDSTTLPSLFLLQSVVLLTLAHVFWGECHTFVQPQPEGRGGQKTFYRRARGDRREDSMFFSAVSAVSAVGCDVAGIVSRACARTRA